jgi:Kef-type K+ transport system membrane component KefB
VFILAVVYGTSIAFGPSKNPGIHAVLGGFFAGLLLAEITIDGPDIEGPIRPVVVLAASAFFFYTVGQRL